MNTTEIKTIDIQTKTWFDKVNGNTYFAQSITINCGMDNEITIKNPFQHGYRSFICFALDKINEELNVSLYNQHELSKKGVIIRHNLYEKCKQRDLKNI